MKVLVAHSSLFLLVGAWHLSTRWFHQISASMGDLITNRLLKEKKVLLIVVGSGRRKYRKQY